MYAELYTSYTKLVSNLDLECINLESIITGTANYS